MKIKLSVTREIQYFELGIGSFNLYVYYLTRGFIATNRAFNLLTLAFNLATRAFSLLTRGFELVTRSSCFTFPSGKSHTDSSNILQSTFRNYKYSD